MNRKLVLVWGALVAMLLPGIWKLQASAETPRTGFAVARPVPELDSKVRVPGSVADAGSLAFHPAVLVLAVLLAGTIVVLVSGTGRETWNSIYTEQAYRASHKSSSLP